jgi:tetratricopeptide (TPR) repeat protein
MIFPRRTLATAGSLSLLASCQWLPQRSPEEVFRRAAPSVYVVCVSDFVTPLRFGSGVALSSDLVVTNKHVAGGDIRKLVEVSHGSQVWQAYPVYISDHQDLCLLRVPGLNAPRVHLRASGSVTVGERVFAVGTPKGLELTISEGLISGIRRATPNSQPSFQISAPISAGSSGGGLFDSQGRLVGLTTALVSDAQNIGFAVGADEIAEALAAASSKSSQEVERASTLFAAARPSQARMALQRALVLQPGLAVAWLALAGTEEGSSSTVRSKRVDCVRAAVQADPSLKDAWLQLAYYSKQDATDLEPLARVALGPQAAVLNAERVAFLREEVGAYEKALSADPNDRRVRLLLADAYNDAGLPERAEEMAREVLATEPMLPEAWKIIGDAYKKRGRRELAAEAYRKVTDSSGSTTEDLFARDGALLELEIYALEIGNVVAEQSFAQAEEAIRREIVTRLRNDLDLERKNRTERQRSAEAWLRLLASGPTQP